MIQIEALALHEPVKEKRIWPMASLLALTGLNLVNYLDRYVLPSVLPLVKKDLVLTDGQSGGVQTVFMLGYFLTSPFFGYLGDKLPRKWLIAAGILIWSIGTTCSGLAHSMVSLILFRIIVGVGEASYGTISPSWIADLFPAAKRNMALSIFYVAIPVGSALGFLVGGAIAAHFGWRAAFLWAGAPGVALALCLLFMREPDRGAMDSAEDKKAAEKVSAIGGIKRYLELFKIPAYVLVVLGYIAQTFALGAFAFWGPTFLNRIHGLELAKADGFFGTALVCTGLTATLIGGYVASLWHKRNPAAYGWVLGLSVLAAVPSSLAAFMITDTGTARIFLTVSMFLLFLSTGPTNTLILESVPVTMRASAMAASIFCIHLFGDLGSPEIVGHIADWTGHLEKAVLILPLALAVAAFFWLWLAIYTQRTKTASH